VIIAVNAATALLGYLAHVTIDVRLAALVTTAAAVGSLLGGRLSTMVQPATLRRAFAGLVIAMAAAIFAKEIRMSVLVAPYIGPLSGGVLVGLAAAALLLLNGRIAGISGIVGGLVHPRPGDIGWRLAFVAGLVAGGAALAVRYPEVLGAPLARPTALFVLAGLLVGAGSRLGNGCTSGHGVCGLGRGSVRSVVATVTFVASGMATVFVARLLGAVR
jgi:uncharacterized membrane protein YedE/YeeE